MSIIDENKQLKKESLLYSAYSLFTRNGINNTTISDITDTAGVAKGTFYLYFKDKNDIHRELIKEKANLLFNEAIIDANNKLIKPFQDKILNIIDFIINELNNDKELLKLIGKDLYLGLEDTDTIKELIYEYKKDNPKIKKADVKLYMIIELVSSSIYSSILYEKPVEIDKLKNYLYTEIKKMLK